MRYFAMLVMRRSSNMRYCRNEVFASLIINETVHPSHVSDKQATYQTRINGFNNIK